MNERTNEGLNNINIITKVSILSILLLYIYLSITVYFSLHSYIYMVWSVLTHFLGSGTAYSLLRRGSSQEKQLNFKEICYYVRRYERSNEGI